MDVVRIGRAFDNDVVFSENEVSRYHCELYCSNRKVYVKDLNSTNGTQVNGNNITTPIWLKVGDKVMLGNKVSIDWYELWTGFYNYSIMGGEMAETVRYDGGGGKTVRNEMPDSRQASSQSGRPVVDIPSSIHIRQQQEHAEVLKSGDDFKVPFKRKLGNNIGHHVGNTLGCIISILIVAALLAIIGFIMS